MNKVSFKPAKGPRGEEQALCFCSLCDAQIRVSTQHGNNARMHSTVNGRNGKPTMTIKSERSVIEAISREGWSYIKRKVRCEACTAEFRKKEDQEVTKAPAPEATTRSPDREMRRSIRSMLDDVYDTVHGRYIGKESDETVASAIGQGCMWGWVAQERIEGYGDGAGNEDTEKAEAGIDAAIEDCRAELKQIEDLRADMVSRHASMMMEVKDIGDRCKATMQSFEKLKQEVMALKPRAARR